MFPKYFHCPVVFYGQERQGRRVLPLEQMETRLRAASGNSRLGTGNVAQHWGWMWKGTAPIDAPQMPWR